MKCDKCKTEDAVVRLTVYSGYDPYNMTWHIFKTIHVCAACADRAFRLTMYMYPETKIEYAGTLNVTSQS